MTPPAEIDSLEDLLAAAAAALEAGDPEGAAQAIDGAVARIARGPAPDDPGGLLAAHARLVRLADRETARVSHELSLLGHSRRAAGAYRGT
jgi:hypothetical protein